MHSKCISFSEATWIENNISIFEYISLCGVNSDGLNRDVHYILERPQKKIYKENYTLQKVTIHDFNRLLYQFVYGVYSSC